MRFVTPALSARSARPSVRVGETFDYLDRGVSWKSLSGSGSLFSVGVLAVLLVDLLVFHRRAQEVTLAEAGLWTGVWFALALGFAGVVWAWQGDEAATAYLTGYLIERSLSIDNVFVLAVIFGYFAVPSQYRHRALLWGVVGALVLRACFIAGGAVALERFSWMVYILGVFLIATGLRLAVREIEAHPDANLVLRLMRRVVPITRASTASGSSSASSRHRLATPMLAVLVAVATTDVAFAADSVPAVFAITDDAFLVFAANAFSVLGMFALYFLLAGMIGRFRYLRPALAAILVFVGLKMAGSDLYEVPVAVSLAVIVSILAAATAASVRAERQEARPAAFTRQSPAQPSRNQQEVSEMLIASTPSSSASTAPNKASPLSTRRDACWHRRPSDRPRRLRGGTCLSGAASTHHAWRTRSRSGERRTEARLRRCWPTCPGRHPGSCTGPRPTGCSSPSRKPTPT